VGSEKMVMEKEEEGEIKEKGEEEEKSSSNGKS
jgi:hypothetical protein